MANIVHISNTPLVGSPGKISWLANENGFNSASIILRDYPLHGGLAEKFTQNSIVYRDDNKQLSSVVTTLIDQADIIHIHNDVSLEFINKFNFGNKKIVYQVHSPLREGPLYFERSEFMGLEFSKKLVIAQYQTRHYQDYEPVPNIVLGKPHLKLREDTEKLRVLFSPTHKRGGRWNNKYSHKLINVLKSLSELNLIESIEINKPLSPSDLFELRKTCHVSIDEIVTGSYHQVSLEGLCAGNIVINNSDFFSSYMLASVSNAKMMPPFYIASEFDIGEKLLRLAQDVELTREYQKKSYDYYIENLMPEKLFKVYKSIYEELLNV
ncbi:hypothetical protein GCM10007161_06120 [Ignatzschineria indica]|uniref:Glycosyltransferase family 1 protein n=1 Tax=Ignatzschineria indica TaxID=472583 RepID=A0A2U2AN63_9GAMM|nr:hypothetical protein [Ignatzschineria indica]PWD84586.1 hypothetical protein DC082_03375 [Ignatzschineria indica]GGZ77676.1 hypothetical protein GCM10007161_06120 [Ignatzschineria indica]